MSVLIKGMEMPNSCYDCRLFVDSWCYAFGIDDWRNAYNKPPKGERLDNCPLVEVPPHGRLIDADDIEKRIKMWLDHPDEYIRKRNQDMLHYIQQEDTVIEAEDGEL